MNPLSSVVENGELVVDKSIAELQAVHEANAWELAAGVQEPAPAPPPSCGCRHGQVRSAGGGCGSPLTDMPRRLAGGGAGAKAAGAVAMAADLADVPGSGGSGGKGAGAINGGSGGNSCCSGARWAPGHNCASAV